MVDLNMTSWKPSANTSRPVPGVPDDVGSDIPAVVAVAAMMLVVGVLGNLLVFATSASSRRIRRKMHLHAFVLSLATADMLFLVLVLPFVIKVIIEGRWTLPLWVCRIQGYVACVTCHASVCSIAAIAVNRYFSVVHVAAYRHVFRLRHVAAMLASLWTYCLLLPLPALVGWTRITYHPQLDACLYDWTYSIPYTVIILTLGYLLPFIVIVGCYIAIWRAFRSSRTRIETRRASVQIVTPPRVSPRGRKDECRLVGQLLALFLAFIICWTPYLLLGALIDPRGLLGRDVYDIVGNMIVLNAIIDPAFYFFFNRTLRSEAVLLIRRVFCCQKVGVVGNTVVVAHPSETTA